MRRLWAKAVDPITHCATPWLELLITRGNDRPASETTKQAGRKSKRFRWPQNREVGRESTKTIAAMRHRPIVTGQHAVDRSWETSAVDRRWVPTRTVGELGH